MCHICDGLSLDDVLALDAEKIDEHGFVLVGVIGPDCAERDPCGWVYSGGLLDQADHPELVVAGVCVTDGGSVLSMLAERVIAGVRYEIGETIDLGCGIATVGTVAEIQYELDAFNMWHNLRSFGALRTPILEARQILLPPRFRCSDQRHAQIRLADPNARVDASRRRPNRAERRRRPRGHRHAS